MFDNSIKKLNETENTQCEGILKEYECASALKEMKNIKARGQTA